MLAGMKAGFLAAIIVGLMALTGDAFAQSAGNGGSLVVVELYTSQGCFQCPRANRLLGMMARRPNVLALTFPVSIWDYLGWRDTLAQPEFSQRQRAYAQTLRVRGRVTPQLIFNGAGAATGGDWDEAKSRLDQMAASGRPPGAPDVSIARLRSQRVRVTIGAGAANAPADIWFVTFDPGPVTVYVSSGDNVNSEIQHFNLVEHITRVDQWDGSAKWFERGDCDPECAVLVQAPNGGPIIAAAQTYDTREAH
jgi:hypothetical protein